MILTKDNIVLVDNEIIVFNRNSPMQYRGGDSKTKIFHNKHFGWQIKIEYTAYPITHATDHSLEGVKHLDRNLFVKKVDVEELAFKTAWEHSTYEPEVAARVNGFIDGYNAKEGEFTREETIKLIVRAVFDTHAGKFVDPEELVNSIRPLSIPESIELDDEFNVVNVKW